MRLLRLLLTLALSLVGLIGICYPNFFLRFFTFILKILNLALTFNSQNHFCKVFLVVEGLLSYSIVTFFAILHVKIIIKLNLYAINFHRPRWLGKALNLTFMHNLLNLNWGEFFKYFVYLVHELGVCVQVKLVEVLILVTWGLDMLKVLVEILVARQT